MKVAYFVVLACILAFASPAISYAESMKQAYEAALKDLDDEAAFQKFLSFLPKVAHPLLPGTTYYLVEGDIPMSERKVRNYLAARANAPQATDVTPELLVNTEAGVPTFWVNPDMRELRYAVLKSTFSSPNTYQQVVTDMKAAGGDWASACATCGIKFVHKSEHDGVSTMEEFLALAHADTLRFVVVYQELGGSTIARAFFPNADFEHRIVSIDPSYFSLEGPPDEFSPVGVLRHELGHVLGYRHEHTRDVPGCFFEDNNWKPLTPYDEHSVMHYYCGGGGNLKLDITDVDREGHRKLYGAPN